MPEGHELKNPQIIRESIKNEWFKYVHWNMD